MRPMISWLQNYDPFGNPWLSTTCAALPVLVLLGLIALGKVSIHMAALLGLAAALGVAIIGFGMPLSLGCAAAGYGAALGLFPIGWIILNLLFLYELTIRRGLFELLKGNLLRLAPDPRLQVILIAFCFGAFFEGAAGFGAPVAITSAILVRLGFPALQACALSLIANTAPVAFGSLGTPIYTLAEVTGLEVRELSAMVGKQLPLFSLIVPSWCVVAMSGFRGWLGIWPAAVIAGLAFAVPQYLMATYHGPALVDLVSSLSSAGALLAFLRFWKPKDAPSEVPTEEVVLPEKSVRAWMPWLVLSVVVFLWGLKPVKDALDSLWSAKLGVPALHQEVTRAVPVALPGAKPDDVFYKLNFLSATGTGILVAGLIVGLWLRFSLRELLFAWFGALFKARWSLITICCMLALGTVTKYCGADATMGLALAQTGSFYPFFGTLLGWLGVALTGSDTASNVLFGGLQKITSQQLGIDPVLMCAANSSGGVMGKMIDAQSIVVASTATDAAGLEGKILRYVFFHSVALAILVGLLVSAMA
jgi:lactate permease